MTNYEQRHANVTKIRNLLQTPADNGDLQAQKALKKLETIEGLGDVGFDALIIPESGPKLTAAIAMFAYYDAAYPQVQFLGTSIWGASKLNNEATFAKSIYPALTKPQTNAFANQYYSIFSEKPSSLYTLAYDAVSIANQLATLHKDNLNETITNESGFHTLNGKVRFFKDGTNQHSLDIVEIRPSGDLITDSGERYFETSLDALPSIVIDETYQSPIILGKDVSLAQVLIYGQVLPENNNSIEEDDGLSNDDIVDSQLKALGIYIN
jgi:hypothetical protein